MVNQLDRGEGHPGGCLESRVLYFTGEYGFVPNQRLKNVFMAAAMDDNIGLHPKNKRLPSSRLAWAAASVTSITMTRAGRGSPWPMSGLAGA